jgi:hypothetical protein
MSYQLPWWMQWIQAVGVIVIAGLGSWIAFKQSKIAAAKLNLDLYDMRFEVFYTTREFLSKAIDFEKLRANELRQFYIDVADATFLFDDVMDQFLVEIGTLASKLLVARQKRDNEETAAANKRCDELQQRLLSELERLADRFKPFMKLGNI